MNELEEIKLPFIADSFEEIQKRINELNISEENLELKKIHISSFPIKHEFPTIQLERSLSDLRGKEVFRQNPFTSVTDLVVSFTLKSNAGNVSSYFQKYSSKIILNILCYNISLQFLAKSSV